MTDETTKRPDDIDERCGPVEPAEAFAILSRFCHSHFDGRKGDTGREKARISIPADPTRDDDLRMHAFIAQSADLTAKLTKAEEDHLAACAVIDAVEVEIPDTPYTGLVERLVYMRDGLRARATKAEEERDAAVRAHDGHTRLLCDAHVAAITATRAERDALAVSLAALREAAHVYVRAIDLHAGDDYLPVTRRRPRMALDDVVSETRKAAEHGARVIEEAEERGARWYAADAQRRLHGAAVSIVYPDGSRGADVDALGWPAPAEVCRAARKAGT